MTSETKTSNRNIGFRMDDNLRKEFEETLKDLGLTFTSAFTLFAKAVVRTGSIPFEVSTDPFYNKENMDELKRRIELFEAGETEGKQIIKTVEELEAMVNGGQSGNV